MPATAPVVGSVSLAVYVPQGRRLDQVRAQAAAQKLAMESDFQKSRVLPEMVRQVEEMKSRYRNMDRRLPKQKELGGFLREISLNMVQQRLSNQIIEPGKPSEMELYHTLPIIMKFQGTYLSAANFLKKIDEMERLARVQRMVIGLDGHADKDDKGESSLNIELQLNIYFTES